MLDEYACVPAAPAYPLVCDWLLPGGFRANALHCGSCRRKRDGRGRGADGVSKPPLLSCCLALRAVATRAVILGGSVSLLWNGRMRSEESSDSECGRMEESSVRRSLETLCQELNMDEQTATEALENFTAIWNTYTLEVRRVPPELSARTPFYHCC